MFTKLLEYLFRHIIGTRIAFDPGIPLSALLMLVARRSLWALRGLVRLALFKRRLGLVFMGKGVEIRCHAHLTLGRGVTLDTRVFIDALSQQGVKIGNAVSLGRYTSIRCTGSLADLGVGVEIGDGTSIGPFGYLGAAGGIRIGRNTIMGNNISFLAENHVADDIHQLIKLQGVTRQGITIGDNCWIGSNAVFLDGCNVGSGCIIGAGAVVRGHIPDRSIAVGVPARVVRIRQ